MRFQSSNTKILYDISFEQGRKKRYQCPECSQSRKKKNQKDLEYFPDNNRAYCFHCETTYFEYKPYDKKEYVRPEWKNKTSLSDKSVKWFESRMISQKTLVKMKIYSDREFMPQFKKEIEVICFPYFCDDQLINIKYRGANKSFKMHSGSELIFYNIDSVKDNDSVIICEGEIDALTYIEIGFNNVISVPNGANNNLIYLENYIDIFKPIDKILISVDNDSKGIELRDELIRRFGAEKCYLINLKDCKDANEFILKYSGVELSESVANAKKVPIKGVVLLDEIQNDIIDLYENGLQPGKTIGNYEIDQYCTWELGKLVIGTGEPNSGKSEFFDYISTRLNLLYKWKVAYFSPENYPLKYHYAKLFEKLIGRKFKKTSNDIEFDQAYEYIKDNFFYILDEENFKLQTIINSAKYLVSRYGIKVLIIDPYNKIDHQREKNETETEYISKFLDTLVRFARINNVLVCLVAHPAKLQKGEIPNLYSISGSAHFYNKADYGFTFVRLKNENNIFTNECEVHWQKFRFKHLGTHGISNLKYNYNNGRFEQVINDVNSWDNSNWLANDYNEILENKQFEFETINDEPPF